MLVSMLALAAPNTCPAILEAAGVRGEWAEGIAHTVHSMTVPGLRMFNPKATVNNRVPTVNHNLTGSSLVLPFAPDFKTGAAFHSSTMNAVDTILATLGTQNDGLGPNWSPTERIVHHFHMQDLWQRVHDVYEEKVVPSNQIFTDACACLTDTRANGIHDKVQWVAEHYKSGTPITLLNRPIPKLEDASSWAIWKERLLHYYDEQQLYNAALYMHCATKDEEAPVKAANADWVCTVCNHVYDAAADGGGVPFEKLPDSWTCPICGSPKSAYKQQADGSWAH